MTWFKCIKVNIAILLFLPFICTNITIAQFDPVFSLVASPTTDVRDVAISHDGNKILTVVDDLKIWNSRTGERLATISDPNVRMIFSAVFSPDDALIATGDAGHNAIIWDDRTGSVLQRFPSYDMNPDNGGIKGVAFTPDGSKLLMGNGNGALQLWNVKTGEELKRYQNKNHIISLFILPDGKRAGIGVAGGVFILDLDRDIFLTSFLGAYPSLSSDGQILQIRASRNGPLIQQWDMSSYELVREYVYEPGQLVGIPTISPDGKNFLIGATINTQLSRTSNRELFDTTSRNLLRQYPVDRASASNSPLSRDSIIKYFPNGRRFLTVNNGTVHIWDISDVVTKVEDAFLH